VRARAQAWHADGVHSDAATCPAPARVTAVVPARNEAARVGATVTELRRWVDEVVVVDDASDDATGAAAQAAGARVVRNETRFGYVRSVQRGFAAASGDVVVTVDADGEMAVERIPALVAPVLAGTADIVQGHRDHVPRWSERIVTGVARLGGPVGDSGTGFRAMRRDLATSLVVRGSCICGSLALDALDRGARISEVPVRARTIHRPRRIAWNHSGQLLVVAGMVARRRLRGAARRLRGAAQRLRPSGR